MRNKGWMTHEWDARDPNNALQDIDTGRYLNALSELPNNIKQMMYDGNMHITVDEVEGHWRIVKIVKKREPEYLTGSNNFFILDTDGNRIPVDEEEWDRLTGGHRNPEDVYEYEGVQLQGLEEHSTPMDVWDILFDATAYINQIRNLQNITWMPPYQKLVEIKKSQKEDIYSADWFPYSQDKRIHSERARKIAKQILAGGISRGQLASMLRVSQDHRVTAASKMKAQGLKMPLGKERAQLLLKAESIKEDIRRSPHRAPEGIPAADKAKLWSIWRDYEMFTKGSVILTSWQFEKMYRAKLARYGIRGKEAQQLVKDRMTKLYKAQPTLKDPPVTITSETANLPDWMLEIPEEEVEQEEYEFSPVDWMDEIPLPDEIDEPLTDDYWRDLE